MSQNVSLDDALSVATASPSNLVPGGNDNSAISQIEALLGGDTPEAPAEPEAEEEVSESPEEDESQDSTPDEESDEEETDSEEEEEATEDEEAEEGDQLELSEGQIAAVLGLEEDGVQLDDDGNLLLRTKIDGKVTYVPANDLTASYQMEKSHQASMKQAAEDRKAFETQKQESTQQLHSTMTDATALVQAMEQQLSASVKGINLEELRSTNPGEYAAVQQDIAQRNGQIQGIKQQMRNVLAQQQQEQQAKNEEQRSSFILDQTEKLIMKVPTWADSEVAGREIAAMQEAVADAYGFTQEELANIGDHRIILAFRDAVKGRSVSKATPEVKKKLKSVPKIVKPGSKTTNTTSAKKRAADQKVNKLRKSGSTQDAASLIADML